MNRHNELHSIIPEAIEAVRIKESSYAVLQKWFDDVHFLIQTHNIRSENTYNMDETVFSLGSIKATRVVLDKTERSRYSAQPGRQEWISVIECISMDGMALHPMIIFKGKTLSKSWIPRNTPLDWMFSCNMSGWMSNEHCKKWLFENFEPNTREKANGRPRLLIFDGHGSHTTADIILHCIQNQIHLALLPPHTSHKTQPLDIGVFSSLKTHMTHELDVFIRNGISRMQKDEWLKAFIAARPNAFMRKNIYSGWSGTGLKPFNPQKVLAHIPQRIPSPTPEVQLRETTPSFESPLLHPDLNSLPIETPCLQAASTHIRKRALDRNTEFDTPARQHVVRMTKMLNRSLAKNRIFSKQLSELQDIVSSRKERQSGKHAILRGQTIIATPANFDRLYQAEQETKARGLKKPKLSYPSAPELNPPTHPGISTLLNLIAITMI
jgi:DDE superfamily endonuclease